MKLETPLVSILIPVYNRETQVARAIESCSIQTYKNIEIIVSDNGSTDGTVDVVKGLMACDRRIRLLSQDVNCGPVENWIHSLGASNGDYIKFLFSDDHMDSTFIESCMDILLSNSSLAFVYSNAVTVVDGQELELFKSEKHGVASAAHFYRLLVTRQDVPVSPGCALFRKGFELSRHIPNNLGIDHSLTGAGIDSLIFMTALLVRPQYYHIDRPLSFFTHHSGSITVSTDPVLLTRSYLTAFCYFFDERSDTEFREALLAELWVYESRRSIHTLVSVARFYGLSLANLKLQVVLWYIARAIVRRLISRL